jgi:hypothetical protein
MAKGISWPRCRTFETRCDRTTSPRHRWVATATPRYLHSHQNHGHRRSRRPSHRAAPPPPAPRPPEGPRFRTQRPGSRQHGSERRPQQRPRPRGPTPPQPPHHQAAPRARRDGWRERDRRSPGHGTHLRMPDPGHRQLPRPGPDSLQPPGSGRRPRWPEPPRSHGAARAAILCESSVASRFANRSASIVLERCWLDVEVPPASRGVAGPCPAPHVYRSTHPRDAGRGLHHRTGAGLTPPSLPDVIRCGRPCRLVRRAARPRIPTGRGSRLKSDSVWVRLPAGAPHLTCGKARSA